MFDKINQLSPQTRMMLAVVVCVLFFVPYSYYVAPPVAATNATKPNVQSQSETIAPTPSAETSVAAPAAVPRMEDVESSEILFEVRSPHFHLIFDKQGQMAQATLLGNRYGEKGKVVLLNASDLRPLELRFSNKDVMQHAAHNPYHVLSAQTHIELTDSPQEVLIEQNLGADDSFVVRKKFIFYPDGHYELEVFGQKSGEVADLGAFFVSVGARPVADNDSFVFKGAMVRKSDGKIDTFEDGDVTSEVKIDAATFLAAVDRYYTNVLYVNEGQSFPAAVVVGKDNNPAMFASFSNRAQIFGYVGAKDLQHLKHINPILGDVVEYGIITFFAKPLFSLLEWLQESCGNWGWAIVLLTLIVRIVLFPLTYKGMVSMQKFKDIAPKMKEIQQKYKDDPQKLQTHMMELYRKHGANPLGGCLPLLLQMPIFFAIYRVLYNAIELKGAAWIGWITDLSVMDPYFVLPVLMGVSMFVQQHITPTSFTDPMQEKVFKYLPVIFTIFFITFPSGLVLYWFVSNLFSIAQQYTINKIMESRKQLLKGEHDEKN
ncbi:MAG: membrane protein insertase YidC [Helicobacter sp.]|nr:membrane protein insertase YidC [Helicobacter sp.]